MNSAVYVPGGTSALNVPSAFEPLSCTGVTRLPNASLKRMSVSPTPVPVVVTTLPLKYWPGGSDWFTVTVFACTRASLNRPWNVCELRPGLNVML